MISINEFNSVLNELIDEQFPNTTRYILSGGDSLKDTQIELREGTKSLHYSLNELYRASTDYEKTIEGLISYWQNTLDEKPINRAGDLRIVANCPNCGCNNTDIEYYNCDSIVYLLCPECGFTFKEGINTEIGELFTTWNKQPYVERVSTITSEELEKRQRIAKRLENLGFISGVIDDSKEKENPYLIKAMVLAKQDKDIPEDLIQKIKEFK